MLQSEARLWHAALLPCNSCVELTCLARGKVIVVDSRVELDQSVHIRLEGLGQRPICVARADGILAGGLCSTCRLADTAEQQARH